MATDRSDDQQDSVERDDEVVSASPSTPEGIDPADAASGVDPADEIPVPVMMEPAEIDERAQAVEAVRGGAVEPRAGAERVRDKADMEPRVDL